MASRKGAAKKKGSAAKKKIAAGKKRATNKNVAAGKARATKKGSVAKKGSAAAKKKTAAGAKKSAEVSVRRRAGASPRVKAGVSVRLSDGEGRVESLRAAPLGGDLYRLEESPSFAYSVSAGDTVRAEVARAGGALAFRGVERKSGNRTLRLLFSRFAVESPPGRAIVEDLQRLGCACDHAEPFVLRLTLPPRVALAEVVAYLKSLAMWWEHADPSYDELYDRGD